MSRRLSTLVVLSCLASHASAGELPGVSHRTRFYDSAAHGENVFVVGYPGTMLRSSDGGKSFVTVKVPTRDALFSVDINNAGVGAAVGRGGLVLLTADGGATWAATNALPDSKDSGDKPHLFAVDVLDDGSMVAVGDFATIVHSGDRGKSWTARTFDPTLPEQPAESANDGLPVQEDENAGFEDEARLTGVSFGDPKHGFIVGEFGIVLTTEDGGVTWKRQRGATDKLLFSVHARTGTHVVAAGSEGTIVETTDGSSWSVVPTPTTNHLFGVWTSSDITFGVGADGTIVRRSAGGPFQIVPSHVHTWLSSVALHDPARGVIAGGLGHLLRTNDAGKSFTVATGE
jgi:photosystem II stability/assembly factor-like uncharacterized protein